MDNIHRILGPLNVFWIFMALSCSTIYPPANPHKDASEITRDSITETEEFRDSQGASEDLRGEDLWGDHCGEEDVFTGDTGVTCPGGPGCECENNSDCLSNLCLETADKKRCAKFCDSDANCPDGYKCTAIDTSVGTVYACAYKFPRLCLPCQQDSDCATLSMQKGALCVAWVPELDANGKETGKFLPGYGNTGAFCGTPCAKDGDCPAGYACQMAETTGGAKAKQCVITSGSCGCTPKAVRLKAVGTCYARNDFGTCTGTQECATDWTMGKCSAKEPKAEVCNHEDDNCDGRTDEGIDTQTDVNNCGDCGIKCTNDHGDTRCVQGKCVAQCDAGFGDCDGDPTNGCETDLSTVDRCGQCTGTGGCPDGFLCKDGACVKKYGNGKNCDTGTDCLSGICKDGVCCDQACDGPCQSCSTGQCLPVKGQDDVPECADAHTCDDTGACVLKDQQLCTKDSDCLSGICEADYDGTGKWCGSGDECFHDGRVYQEGAFSVDCWDTNNRAQCKAGQWTKVNCGANTCSGECGGATNGCLFHVKGCDAGHCVDKTVDVDTMQARCTACKLSWALGGEVAASTCCGDDPDEYALTCKDSSANGNCGKDTQACCKAKNDCVDDHGNCVTSGKCVVFGTAKKKSFCDTGQWQDPDEKEAYCENGCGYKWLADGIGKNARCCGDDPGEFFEQTSGNGRSCCYNAKVLASGASNASILCFNGQLYDCNKQVVDNTHTITQATTCQHIGGFYCSKDNTWKKGADTGCTCTGDKGCLSGHCSKDYDKTGQWCAEPGTCVHNKAVYQSEQYSKDCFDSKDQARCVNGQWVTATCGTDNTCTHHYCAGGACKVQYAGITTSCNGNSVCSSGTGDGRYNHSGHYVCKGYCDGSGHCDYAGSCQDCNATFYGAYGTCSNNVCSMTSCHNGYGNCNGSSKDGCETNLTKTGSCGSPVKSLVAYSYNTCVSLGQYKYYGTRWFKIHVICSRILTCNVKFSLSVPSGTNYDLYLYEGSSCSALHTLKSSTNGGSTAESIMYSWPYGNKDFYVQVHFVSGNTCAQWLLAPYAGKYCK